MTVKGDALIKQTADTEYNPDKAKERLAVFIAVSFTGVAIVAVLFEPVGQLIKEIMMFMV